jgi:L-ribulose-5-phosphate 3-epimerase
MKPLRVGIAVESTGLPLRQAVAHSGRIGAEGIQADALGDLNPDALGDTGRREFRNILRSSGQELIALRVPLRRGLDVAEHLQPRLELVRKVMQFAFDLGARKVVVPFPRLPEDEARAALLRESLTNLGPFGDRIGTTLALEIGYDSAAKVRDYLGTFDTGSLKVTYDPANMLIHGHDPLANLTPLAGMIAHVLARDARAAGVSSGMQEVPLGAGDVEWMAFVATLQVIEYTGFLTVKRDAGENKLADVTNGVAFLRRFTGV